MSSLTEWTSVATSIVSAAAAAIAAGGVIFAYRQLQTSKEIAQLQFEDSLAREYRQLASKLPTKALLGEPLSEQEFGGAFDELFHYMDLSNEQVSLRQRGRVSAEVWVSWCEGIKGNLALPAFAKAWVEIKAKSESFRELRRLLERDESTDPHTWRET